MKAAIEVSSMKEAQSIRRALVDPEVRAFVTIIGVLLDLPAPARKRALMRALEQIETNEETKAG